MNRAMSSSRKVSVSLTWLPIVSRQVPVSAAGDDQALDDEAVRRLDEQHVRMPRWSRKAPIERKTSSKSWRGTALVDPHAGRSSVRSQSSGPAARDPSRGARLTRKTPVAASVTSAPVTSKATTTVVGVRGGGPGDR